MSIAGGTTLPSENLGTAGRVQTHQRQVMRKFRGAGGRDASGEIYRITIGERQTGKGVGR